MTLIITKDRWHSFEILTLNKILKMSSEPTRILLSSSTLCIMLSSSVTRLETKANILLVHNNFKGLLTITKLRYNTNARYSGTDRQKSRKNSLSNKSTISCIIHNTIRISLNSENNNNNHHYKHIKVSKDQKEFHLFQKITNIHH